MKKLQIIVLSQFCCTSLWFAGNAVTTDITHRLNLAPGFVGSLTSAVQFGFIAGTLLFAIFTIADRFSPSRVFFCCSLIAAGCNLGIVADKIGSDGILLFRFLTGFFLAGIYPVGMKIAADHYREGLGRSLGLLVGALVLGTALPHLLRTLTGSLPWKYILFGTSLLSVAGGTAMLCLVPDGPYRKRGRQLDLLAFTTIFRIPQLRAAAFGYFGHMWELYTFWAFVPAMLRYNQSQHQGQEIHVPLLSFFIIGIGSIACAVAGRLSLTAGAKKIAAIALSGSGLCCLFSPFFIGSAPAPVLVVFLLIWGALVVADSPLFSTLVAQQAPDTEKGSALTFVTCIGFAITIISIQLLSWLTKNSSSPFVYLVLALGPAIGLICLFPKSRKDHMM